MIKIFSISSLLFRMISPGKGCGHIWDEGIIETAADERRSSVHKIQRGDYREMIKVKWGVPGTAFFLNEIRRRE